MKVLLAVLLCALKSEVFSFGVVIEDNSPFRLDIVHYNDFHARFEETSLNFPMCLSNDTDCLGGFARLYHEVMVLLKEKPDALLLNAGDSFQGTYWYSLLKWNVTQEFMNMLPNDAHALGNHEFDDGQAGLRPYIKALKAPVIAANINTTDTELEGLVLPHVLVERKGRKIGIIGLITPDTAKSSNPGNLMFLDPIATARKEAEELTQSGIDIIIVLSHCGLGVDKKIAQEAGENIDLIVGGHSHSLLWNGTAPSKEAVSGPYPVIVTNETNPDHKVLVVTASAFSKYLGNISVYFDNNGELQSFDGKPVYLNRSIPEDEHIKELLRPYKEKLTVLVQKVVGHAPEDLLLKPCSRGECALGNLVSDSMMHTTKEFKVSDLTHVGFIIMNALRSSIPKGEITRGDVINLLPFTNYLVTFRIKGRYILDALEHCMTNVWSREPFTGPWMPHVSGMQVKLNVTNGSVESVLVRTDDEGLEPLQLQKEYQFFTLSFIARGGSGFKMFKEHARDLKVLGQDADVVETYIRKISVVPTILDQRLKVVT